VDEYVGIIVEEQCKGKHSSRDVTSSQQWLLNLTSTDMSYSQAQLVFIVEHYVQSQSYLKCQDDFRIAFPKSQVPDKSTVFRLAAHFLETGSVSD
jgi:hypothetical protein